MTGESAGAQPRGGIEQEQLGRDTTRTAALLCLAGAAMWWIAGGLLIPADDYFYSEETRDEALAIANHEGMFRGFHLVATVGVILVALAVVLIGRRLRAQRPSRLVDVAVVFAVVGLVAWLIEVALRMTVTISRANDVAAGLRGPGDEPALGNVVVFLVAALTFFAPMLLSWELARRAVPGRRFSFVVAVLVTLGTAAGVAFFAPSMVYQFALLPLIVALMVAWHRAAPESG